MSRELESLKSYLVALRFRRESLIELRTLDIERLQEVVDGTPEHELALQKWALHDADYDSTVEEISDVQTRIERAKSLLEDHEAKTTLMGD